MLCTGTTAAGVARHMRRVDLRYHNLLSSAFDGVDMRGANLDNADLRGSTLYDTNLAGASLRGARLAKVKLARANLRGARRPLGRCEGGSERDNGERVAVVARGRRQLHRRGAPRG